jgi:integrase
VEREVTFGGPPTTTPQAQKQQQGCISIRCNFEPPTEESKEATFYALSRQIGLRGMDDSRGPRLHDMRHVFATNTLLRWYEAEQDPERLLPILSTYLGHVHVADTQWYLSGSPELMKEAMGRLERRWEDRT